ncbi:hypothetical protein [Pacificibacter marinus]|uniref:hypothetical protein n=1 Tax=Pacificibacter marinus TaxID=658057 RepID=UPI001C06CE38|nr:hypothetical protein [Pacificibacter marinus]MBU2868531.1 hypothetical protein [Pacificibacter marinus]
MVSDSKILTVSYGTFSCTLEGFDDPFSTMRGIAEYFRDLAADDRYFGAEPPTPDANMLHSIAEKEIQRRVEAKVQGNGVVLRQMDDGTTAPASDGIAQPASVSDTVAASPKAKKAKRKKVKKAGKPGNTRALQRKAAAKAKAAPVVEMPLAAIADADDTAADDTDLAQTASVETQTDSVVTDETLDAPAPAIDRLEEAHKPASIADKLERIRAAVAQRGTSAYAEDQHATDSFGDSQDDTIAEDTSANLVSNTVAEAVTSEDTEKTEEDAKLAAQAKAAQDRVAAKRARRMRLKAAAEAKAAAAAQAADVEQAQITEDTEVAEDTSSTDASADETSVDSILSALGDTPPNDDASNEDPQDTPQIDPEVAQHEAQADEPDTDADQALHDMDPTLAADIAEATRAPEVAAPEATEQPDPLRRVRARVIKMRRSDVDLLPDQAEPNLSETETEAETESTDVNAESLSTKVDLDPQADETIAPAEEDDLAKLLRKELGTSSLDDDAEDELMRELAEVTSSTDTQSEVAADILSDESDDADAELDDVEAEVGVAQPAANVEPENEFRLDRDHTDEDDDDDDDETRNMFGTSDDSVSRLLDTAEREMGDGENVRRRNAIQHLKAAVAATRAEQAEQPDTTDAKDAAQADPYREDLARVVRPRRPTEALVQGVRRLAPLMLVSEQRIDTPQDLPLGANISPVRPRRVSSAALAVKEDEQFAPELDEATATPMMNEAAGTFADYAETVGAEGLNDLLEAAAAYSSFVEGRETVTRPQIMRLANQAMPEDFPLEERLRSFGQLLRQGKIRKIKRGHFVIADGTRFKPEAAAS